MENKTKLYCGDCLEVMQSIPSGSVDFICADLPYGITDCAWDGRIDFDRMWREFLRVTKDNAAIALFAAGKFLIELAASNLKMYRYKWVWEKNLACGFLNAKKMPLRAHEDILIFYRKLPTYNPQFTPGKPYDYTKQTHWSENYRAKKCLGVKNLTGDRHPRDVQKFKICFTLANGEQVHSTQKPVALLEYLIKTYSNEGDVVLDPVMGSGSCGVACAKTGRKFIGIELNPKYYDIAAERIENVECRMDNEQNIFNYQLTCAGSF